MLKATIASVLAMSAAVSLSACSNKQQEAVQPAAAPAAVNHPAAQPGAEVDLAGIPRAEGGKTVAEVFSKKSALAGQKISVRGKVVKAHANIMNLGWLHIRDGSGADGTNDLTVTTTTMPLPQLGSTIVVTGTVALDKDFGMGYQYPVLLENAEVKIESTAE